VLAALFSQAVPLIHAIECAQRAAAIAVGRRGTFSSIPTVDEMRHVIEMVSSEEGARDGTDAMATSSSGA
jgi:ribokinase